MEKISFGKYVELSYEIFVVSDGQENSVYAFTDEKPDGFVFGQDLSMIEGFARHLEGLTPGTKFDFTLEPAEAFGERSQEWVITLPRESFEIDGEFDNERVFVGAWVPMQTDDGHRMEGLVRAIDEANVTLDFNHQLAGERVRYVGQVLTVRDATSEELAPQHGCGCGCDSCGHDHGHDGCGDCGGCH